MREVPDKQVFPPRFQLQGQGCCTLFFSCYSRKVTETLDSTGHYRNGRTAFQLNKLCKAKKRLEERFHLTVNAYPKGRSFSPHPRSEEQN
ncbi:hypothetical protein J6590_016081 [Homalodisca vitripennis]|nr:hypothetical protein J6590_016081 [Homalodisca vitripennis]